MGFFGDVRDFVKRESENATSNGGIVSDIVDAPGEVISDIEREVFNGMDYLGNFTEAPGSPNTPDPNKIENRIVNDAKDLLSQINSDETISDVTRNELTAQIEEGVLNPDLSETGNFGEAENIIEDAKSTFSAAKEGEAEKFVSRQAVESRFETIQDRPGRQQTFLFEGIVNQKNNLGA